MNLSILSCCFLALLSFLHATQILSSVSSNVTLSNPTYIIQTLAYVEPEATLTIAPGVTLLFNQNASLIVKGTLKAIGTKDNPVLFTSTVQGQKWKSIRFDYATGVSFLENSIVKDGGEYSRGSIEVFGSLIHVKNLTFDSGSGFGIYSCKSLMGFSQVSGRTENSMIVQRSACEMTQTLNYTAIVEQATANGPQCVPVIPNTFVYLSDITPTSVVNVHGGIGIDRPYWTPLLQLNQITYAKGVVQHSPGSGNGIIEYALAGNYSQFTCILGTADDPTGSWGSSQPYRMKVLVDDVERLSVRAYGQYFAQAATVDVSGASKLTLVVHNEGGNNFGCSAAWADAKLYSKAVC